MAENTLRVLILGATSAIAEAAARDYAERGAQLFLVGRNESNLQAMTADLKVRGAESVGYRSQDLLKTADHAALIQQAKETLGHLDVVLIGYGYLGDQAQAEKEFEEAKRILEVNLTSVISLAGEVAEVLEAQQSGTLAVISSVAGDRGRPSNYFYGTAKGGLNLFLQGLRARLFKKGVRVLTVKPGWVDTPMIAHLPPNRLTASAASVGKQLVQAMGRRKDVVYLPGVWRWILLGVRSIPEGIFKRMSL